MLSYIHACRSYIQIIHTYIQFIRTHVYTDHTYIHTYRSYRSYIQIRQITHKKHNADPATDLAVCHAHTQGLVPWSDLGDSSLLKVGQVKPYSYTYMHACMHTYDLGDSSLLKVGQVKPYSYTYMHACMHTYDLGD